MINVELEPECGIVRVDGSTKANCKDGIVISSSIFPQMIRQKIVDNTKWSVKDETEGWLTINLSSPPHLLAFAQLMPDPSQVLSAAERLEKQKSLQHLSTHINDFTVDVFDMVMANWIETNQHSVLHANDFLEMRGLTKYHNGAFDSKLKADLELQLTILSNMWVTVEKIELFLKKTNKTPNRFTNLKGRILSVSAIREFQDNGSPFCWYIQPGEVMRPFLVGPNKQLSFMTKKILEYNPVKNLIEKRLARHLLWHFRIRQSRGDYLRPFNNGKMLENACIKINERYSMKVRERIEQAFDRLAADGIIRSWQYSQEWNEEITKRRGWFKDWLAINLLIEPPTDVINFNENIPNKQNSRELKIKPENSVASYSSEISSIKKFLAEKGISQLTLAEKLHVSPQFLSMVINGKKKPSSSMMSSLKSLIHQVN